VKSEMIDEVQPGHFRAKSGNRADRQCLRYIILSLKCLFKLDKSSKLGRVIK